MPQPKLLSKAWASDGLKNNIPDTRSGGMPLEGATYADGFPSITMTPISTGGKPPSGKDMNGVLYEISAHTVWQNQGGRYRFDQTFCDTIGGYPKGSVLISDTLDTEYISLVDANTHNPNSGNNTGKWEIHAGKGLKASTTQAGSAQLSSATNSDREDMAATPKAVKIAYDKAVGTEAIANRKSEVAVLTGVIYDGDTLPLPAGYTERQCKWLVSLRDDNASGARWDIDEGGSHNHFAYLIHADGARRVTAKMRLNGYPDRGIHVNYIVIGVK